jgi:hypothetical protein
MISNILAQETPKLSFKELGGNKIQTIKGDLALIQIYSNLNLTFDNKRKRIDSLIIGQKDANINNYKLLITLDSKTVILEVNAKGYLPLSMTVMGITPKAYKVYNIFEENSELVNNDLGAFRLESEPDSALIRITGQPEFKNFTPYTFANRTAMAYKITLTKQDYYDVDTIMKIVKNDEKSLKVNLRAKFGFLKLKTDTENDLLIDGKSYSHNSPVKIMEGKHSISVKRKYSKEYNENVEIFGQFIPTVLERKIELEHYKGRLEVNSDPPGAVILLNGDKIGVTPLNSIVDAGEYTLEFRKEKFRTEKKDNIEILKDETVRESMNLKPYGLLKITGMSSAEIILNDKHLGTLPFADGFELPPGNYTLKAELEGYDTGEQSFYLDTEVKTVNVDLYKSEGKFFRSTGGGRESRLNQITPPIYLYISSHIETINPKYLSTAAGYPFYEPVKNAILFGGGINITALPISIELDAHVISIIPTKNVPGSEQLTNYPDSTLFSLDVMTAKVGYCPFVLFERIYPFVGIMAHISGLWFHTAVVKNELQQNFDKDEPIHWHIEPALYADIDIRISEKFSLFVGYEKFLKANAFGDGLYAHFAWSFFTNK